MSALFGSRFVKSAVGPTENTKLTPEEVSELLDLIGGPRAIPPRHGLRRGAAVMPRGRRTRLADLKQVIDEKSYDTLVSMLGRGGRGVCGGNRRFDGSGMGIGNVGTRRQPGSSKTDR